MMQEQIESILEEANAYGLRWEVDTWAKEIISNSPQINIVKAYEMAFKEWIK